MGRTPCCSAEGIKKGAWTSDEDKILTAYIEKHGEGGWRTLPLKAGLQRCGKSCRLRWTNYLKPDIKRGEFNPEEEQKIIELHATLGNRWSAIAKQLEKRTDNEIKNYWNTHLKKRVAKTMETKCELANSTKSSSSTNGQPSSTNHDPNNNGNNHVRNLSSHEDDNNSTSVMPGSASVRMLNRLATGLPSSFCLDILKDGPLIQNPSTCKDVVSISDASSSDSDSRAGSSSARSLLNKMARNRPTVFLEMIKSIMSKSGQMGTDTIISDDLFYTSKTNGQTRMQPTTSMSIEAAENVASDMMVQDVPSHGVQDDKNGIESVESLSEVFDLGFLQNWTMMDDDYGTVFIGGGSYEGGVTSTCINSDSHIIQSTMTPLTFVNSFEPESEVSCELSDFMNIY